MKKTFFFSLVLFLVWAGALAQIKLNGRVTDAQTRQPLKGVLIQITETNQSTVSDQDGNFTFSGLSSGTYTLKFSDPGYDDLISQAVLHSGSSETFRFAMNPGKNLLQTVEVSALRATENMPVSFTSITKDEIVGLNTGRDIPFLLEQTPSVVSTSDAGAGIGYTNIRVRGSDISRINVTVNGIPINDAESHGVFWVNMPDLASSTSSIQLQRGVGTSTNGAAAFGASLNMETDGFSVKPSALVHLGAGSFNTKRATAQFNTGLLQKNWWLSGRLSSITSDGYVDRASSDLKSYFLSGGFVNERTSVKAVVFGGNERTYQSWYGLDSATFATNPTFNYAGAIYDDTWSITGYYKDQVDRYAQDHYQLHLNHALSKLISGNVSMHYTYGRGYYEEYRQDEDMVFYGLDPIVSGGDTIDTTDLVRRKWLNNDFYGMIGNIQYSDDQLTSILGGGINRYDGDHFGEVIWARFASESEPGDQFYNSTSQKTDWNVYWKNLYQFNRKIIAFADLQLRGVNYSSAGLDDDVGQFSFAQNNLFFNPKAGITYMATERKKLYLSYARANREPNRVDFLYADPGTQPLPEKLDNVELGFQHRLSKINYQANLYYMYYTNQLVLSGKLDAVGNPIRENIGKSYRAGVELMAEVQIMPVLRWQVNATLSRSTNLDFSFTDASGSITQKNTPIAYAPEIIGASTLEYTALKVFKIALFSKYVGEQYLSNEAARNHVLPGYFINDLRFSWDSGKHNGINARIYLHVQNLFNVKYASNGYIYDNSRWVYAQAGLNFLAGVQLSF